MNGEHNTPVGTPVVIAPGKIPLVGEYAVLEEGSAVLAAITRHAKAQFIPRMDAMSPMVAEVVKRTKAELGEVSAALPPGSVLVNTDAFQQGSERSGFGTSAAIAVASVGAVFEALGLTIESHKWQILSIADAARRAAQGNVGSGADLATATHGGLVKIIRQKDASPKVEPLTAPAGLHLVLFSARNWLPTHQMLEGVQHYAKHDPAAFGQAMDNLREIAQRFVEELTAGSATGAVCAAGRYGERLAKLGADAQVPIMTDTFTLASELARALGGIAKPTGAGGGSVGVAMFATPEATRLFTRACPESLIPLDGSLDRLGVRCQAFDATDGIDAIESDAAAKDSSTPETGTLDLGPVRDVVEIVSRAEDVDTAPAPADRKLDVTPPPDFAPAMVPNERGVRRQVVSGAAIVIALGLVAWIALPNPIRARVRGTGPTPNLPVEMGLANAPSLAPLSLPVPPAETMPQSALNESPTDSSPLKEDTEPLPKPTAAHLAKHPRKVAFSKPASGDATNLQKHSPAPTGSAKSFVPRAGKLSTDDF